MAASAAIEQRRQRIEAILPILRQTYPSATCTLTHRTPLQLLVATILSAQCTDQRVNLVTRDLFQHYRAAADFAAVPQEQLERDIQSTGFFRNKAKAIRAMAARLVADHGGQVPQSMEELTALPGVGRKTANVVLGNAFGVNVGVVVDTHVGRLAGRLGLSRHSDPTKIEQDLMNVVPRPQWTDFSHLLIAHGRALCTARNPRCGQCPLLPYCPHGTKVMRRAAARPGPQAVKP